MAQAPKVVNLHQLSWTEHSHGTRFAMRRKALGAASAGKQLGCSYYELPPGKTAFPYHFHTANEEAFYVLEGEAELRTPVGESDLRAGDYVVFRAGPDGAHQIRNRGETPLRYLCVSTMVAPCTAVRTMPRFRGQACLLAPKCIQSIQSVHETGSDQPGGRIGQVELPR